MLGPFKLVLSLVSRGRTGAQGAAETGGARRGPGLSQLEAD